MTTPPDIAVLGSGFGGCLTALILKRMGRSVVVVDRGSHPRFAIGESSTPIADSVLHDLARRYDLPRLLPLCRYGSWQAKYPEVACGLKRGFSYLHHEPGRQFLPDADHRNELLVTASANDDVSDTHWFRADVDAFFANEAREAGVELVENATIDAIDAEGNGWRISASIPTGKVELRTSFVIDATGAGMALPRALGIRYNADDFRTYSRAVFVHFENVAPWQSIYESAGGDADDHPFPCDAAALHHLLAEGWMWQLRFDNGITSAGIVFADSQRSGVAADEEWRATLDRYPSVAAQFAESRIANPPLTLRSTGRLQRRVERIAGDNWALLPHTAGFVDPLHSTGIAQTLCGIDRLMTILERHWKRDSIAEQLRQYEREVFAQIALIDSLVAGCYRALPRFDLFTAWSMLYFAAATTCEQRRGERESDGFLLANDVEFRGIVDRLYNELVALGPPAAAADSQVARFEQRLAAAIGPYNSVGLCDPSVRNMYRYTAAPM